jgi:hypothetical protein
MSWPAVEAADILRAPGNHFLDRYKKSFSFSSSKLFGPFKTAAQQPWAAISMPVYGAVTRPSPVILPQPSLSEVPAEDARTVAQRT